MKIVLLGTAHPYRGGIAAFTERLAKQLVDEGHEVEVVTFTMQYPNFLFPGKTQYTDSPAPKNLKITRLVNSVNPLSWVKAARYISSLYPDMLIVKFWIPLIAPSLGSIARLVKWQRKQKTQIIGVMHNVIPHEKRPLDTLLANFFVGSCDRFLVLSDSVKKDLRHLTNKPILQCPHPLYDNFGNPIPKSIARAQLGLNSDETVLLFFGFIRDYKGLDLLMRAYADQRIDKNRVRLMVAGEFYNNEDKYKQLEVELQLQGHIRWFSQFIPDDKVAVYFSAADIVVQPYKSATQSGVTQIAYHFDKPMIVTNVGGLSEIVPNGRVGYVVPVSTNDTETTADIATINDQATAADIATVIVDFVNNAEPDYFFEGIQTEKQRYSWSRMTNALLGSQKAESI